MAVRVNFEIGHEASIRTKKTPEGFTHDWEVFVRGQEGADISHFIEKVVFHLHETFPKPKRVVKEPPFTVKESGYAGFTLPIEIILKNKDEPKKIKFTYELNLQQSGPATLNFMKDRYIFHNPNEDFKKKLIKGGGFIISNHTMYANPDQDTKSRDSFTDEKSQLVSKPKLSGESSKKHRPKDDTPLRFNSFENLFGTPLQKPSKVSPELKKVPPVVKSEKKDKDKHSSDKDKQKSKHEHKDKIDKIKNKEDKLKEEKLSKVSTKDNERSKDKPAKRQNERPVSPSSAKKIAPSPVKKPLSPPPRSSSASSIKEELKPPKIEQQDQKKLKLDEKPPEMKAEKEKKKKDKKDKDRDKSRKEHKRDHKSKDVPRESPKEIPKIREPHKDKEMKETPTKEKPKIDKPFNKFSIENLVKTPQDIIEENKSRDKEPEPKHKHKKKDKKRDENREKHKDSNKEKKHKHDKNREHPSEPKDAYSDTKENREAAITRERPILEPGSPISLDTASQCSSKSGMGKGLITIDDGHTSHSDSENSVLIEDDLDIKVKPETPQLPEVNKEKPPSPEPESIQEPPPGPSQKEKSKKHKDKSSKRDSDEKKRRKRKNADNDESESRKVPKVEAPAIKIEGDRLDGESSAGTSETKVQDNGVSSSLGEDAEPGDLSPDYMVQLRELQQRIMTIKSNEELERVVNLIAETGRYEVTTQTFDFDLCLLDRSTVQRLIQLVG